LNGVAPWVGHEKAPGAPAPPHQLQRQAADNVRVGHQQYIPVLLAAYSDGVSLGETCLTEKNGFVTATKLGTTDKSFAAATKNFATATKRFVENYFVVVTKCF